MKKNEVEGLSPWKIAKRRFVKNKLAVLGLILLGVITLGAVFGPMLTPYEAHEQQMMMRNQGPQGDSLLGFDSTGRDILTRVLHGGRVSLAVGIVATSVATIIGVVLGSIAGFYGGIRDGVIMRLVDIVMSFPFFIIAAVASAAFGPTVFNTMLIIGLINWTLIARVVRAEILSLKEQEFVEASRALGLDNLEIIRIHLIPNVMAPIIVYSTLTIASAILIEAGLSFIGLGVSPPTPTWGNMLEAARSLTTIQNYWWQWIPPGLMIFFTVLSINFVGDGLRDALDPKLKE